MYQRIAFTCMILFIVGCANDTPSDSANGAGDVRVTEPPAGDESLREDSQAQPPEALPAAATERADPTPMAELEQDILRETRPQHH